MKNYIAAVLACILVAFCNGWPAAIFLAMFYLWILTD